MFGLGIPLLALLVIAAWLLFPLFPHRRVEIILPFVQQYDAVTGLIPMGETRFHPKPAAPHGHPGIDFGGQERFPLIASFDGKVTKLLTSGQYKDESQYDIILSHGAYQLRYFEVDDPAVHKGDRVKQGDLIAYVQRFGGGDTNEPIHYSTHWEFGSASPFLDRLCPLNYFTAESRQRIDAIWGRVLPTDAQGIKQEFPDICSGDYKDRVEPGWVAR